MFGVGYASDQNSPLTVPITKTKDIGAFSRENGEKLPLFFNPNHKQTETEQEVKTTHEARTSSGLKNHVAEVAISFKEPMTYAEIQAKLPDNLLINWYWLGMASDQLSVTDTIGKVIGINADEAGKLEDESLETSSSSSWSSANYPSFVTAVKTAAEKRGYNVAGIDIYKDALKQVEKYPTLKTAKFVGIIVSGRTENLATLDDEPYIFATNVGLQAEILPYIEPTK
ncbi:anti sigma factor C-terminal domain-containing protein [Pseudolactococcus laudensis]|uniref:anti sigma factor C-terminal domain-containing protein n=1 Tax=Pseudolactococcus laudensis TaxID=1494461 RepID=UPI0031B5A715